MNVRVNLDYTIYDGAEIVFKAPCDADQVTGLIVYYPNGTEEVSSVFSFADAHTNDLGHIDDLFYAGAVVKVILDTETNMAFVQNAPTNAYLEGRFDRIGANTMIVTLSDNRFVASRDSKQIYDHVANGGYAVLYDGVSYLHLAHCDEVSAYFSTAFDDYVDEIYIVYDNARCVIVDRNCVSMERLDETIGSISSALDHIIALQESLIDGSVSTITFTIDGEEYTARSGMTWREWCKSNYNTIGMSIEFGYPFVEAVGYITLSETVLDDFEKIVAGAEYQCIMGVAVNE